MHSKSIVHRDLKLDNILINQMDEVKLIDFGFAVKCDQKEKLTTFCGTPHYMDPDLVKKHPYYGQGADVWALGVILFILLTGRLPFFAEFEADLFRKIQGAKYQYPRNYRQGSENVSNTLSSGVKQIIKRILEPNVNLRPTAQQLLDDPWIKGSTKPLLGSHSKSNLYSNTQKLVNFKEYTDNDLSGDLHGEPS